MLNNHWLVVWNCFLCSPIVGNVIIPTDDDSHIFQRGGEKPPTSLDFWVAILDKPIRSLIILFSDSKSDVLISYPPVICEFKMKTLGRYSWDILTAGRVSDCWSNDWRLLDKMQYVCCTPIMWSGWNIILIGYSCRKPQWLENMESNKPRFPVLLIYCGWTKPCTSR